MVINVQQSIHIHMIKIGGITNSSVLQIGTTGIITEASNLFNTGGFTGAAPSTIAAEKETALGEAIEHPILVPL
ncbi:spore germination protein GerPB [Lederbergia panacisoli]|nr:spore germination protein GerPB [Lederbergia panacisoli]MCR2821013.1 spore germination protein GerPB [Lederbergia panacisoli]